jgi:hypothetical protein
MYRIDQFLEKVKAFSTGSGYLLDCMMLNLCSCEFKVAYCGDPEGKLPTPPPALHYQS